MWFQLWRNRKDISTGKHLEAFMPKYLTFYLGGGILTFLFFFLLWMFCHEHIFCLEHGLLGPQILKVVETKLKYRKPESEELLEVLWARGSQTWLRIRVTCGAFQTHTSDGQLSPHLMPINGNVQDGSGHCRAFHLPRWFYFENHCCPHVAI